MLRSQQLDILVIQPKYFHAHSKHSNIFIFEKLCLSSTLFYVKPMLMRNLICRSGRYKWQRSPAAASNVGQVLISSHIQMDIRMFLRVLQWGRGSVLCLGHKRALRSSCIDWPYALYSVRDRSFDYQLSWQGNWFGLLWKTVFQNIYVLWRFASKFPRLNVPLLRSLRDWRFSCRHHKVLTTKLNRMISMRTTSVCCQSISHL